MDISFLIFFHKLLFYNHISSGIKKFNRNRRNLLEKRKYVAKSRAWGLEQVKKAKEETEKLLKRKIKVVKDKLHVLYGQGFYYKISCRYQ
jgi:hypothetical protein